MKNKVALVTGAADGIGRASAIAFGKAGAKVVVADINPQGGEETVRLIAVAGGKATFIQTDVVRANDVALLVRRTIELYGRLDYAHNNAGVLGTRLRTADRSEEEWDRTIGVNLKGVWLCMKHEIPRMLEQGGGAIVNTASAAGLVGFAKSSAYTASKHAVVGLTKAAALEYVSAGIRINAVCPGLIETEMVERTVLGDNGNSVLRRLKKFGIWGVLAAKQPSRRIGTAEEVAEAVLWLCSDAASYVNGHALVVDGGFVAE